MTTAMCFALAVMAAILGCALLALSQDRHARAIGVRGRPAGSPRIAGWGVLGASLTLCVASDGGEFAAITWPMLLAAATLVIAAALAWRPTLLLPLARSFWPE